MDRPGEYRENAIACRTLALKLGAGDKQALILTKMAETWERLAEDHDRRRAAHRRNSN